MICPSVATYDFKIPRIVTILLTLFLLNSCGGGTSNIRFSSIDDDEAATSAGYVGFVVAGSKDRLQGWVSTWHSLIVRDTATDMTHVISAKEDLDTASKVYLGALPTGSYQAERLFAQYRSDSGISFAAYDLTAERMVFDIAPGRFVNLGGLAFHGQKEVIELEDPEVSIWEKLFSKPRRHYISKPAVEYFATDIPYRVFESLHQTHNVPKVFNRSINNAARPHVTNFDVRDDLDRLPTMTTATTTENKQKLIFGYFGAVLHGNLDDEWQLLFSPDLYTLSAASTLDEDSFVIGDEFGHLQRYNHRLNEWKRLNTSLPLGRITFLDRVSSDSLLVIQRYDEKHFVRLLDLNNGRYNNLMQFEKEIKTDIRIKILPKSSFALHRDAHSIHYFLGNRLWSLDRTDHSLTPLSDDTFDHAYLQGNGILAAEPDDFFSASFLVSKDGGDSWSNPLRGTKSNSSPERRSFVGDNGHLLMLSPTQVRSGVTYHNGDARLQYSDNLAQSWEVIGEVPADCQDLLHEISDEETIYMYCQEGDLMYSRDFGQHWLPIYNYQQPHPNEPQELRT